MNHLKCYLNAVGMICAAGSNTSQIKENISKGILSLEPTLCASIGKTIPLGKVNIDLPNIPLSHKKWHSRNNQIALAALLQVQAEVDCAIKEYGKHRVAVIIGTSTSGIAESETGLAPHFVNEKIAEQYDYGLQEMGAPAQFLANLIGATGPVYGISTACSSGAKALASARRLLAAGLCDAVVAGGVDTLCELTIQGFSSLQAVSESLCNPFSVNRDGINIGEGSALFLVTNKSAGVELKGAGESSDAYHISAPDPSGKGALQCMQDALNDANLLPNQIDYINLHGTATELNDQMESRAVNTLFGDSVLCSSTKPFTGHTLGAAGAIEAGFCWLILDNSTTIPFIPQQVWDGIKDPDLPPLNMVKPSTILPEPIQSVLTNSFAFGGNNISLILGRI